ncbi:putative ragulator complex protein LAMTOR1 isoform X4 [Apostichopus japonicus]|uniref:Putative ragulator complex protein LAMTOR1 isoform X4 n=1 Tax=Stichopus japonicus TaxID=307972 RepID=A0A2G8K758_STIJA|nr:putative ragulator complex protein LAMTOR1 isoform X4 [Apostichopus japonicus]
MLINTIVFVLSSPYVYSDLSGFITEPWLLHWLAQFLTGWSRHVKLENGLSDRSEIKVGVPQGGPLSALLFTLYTDEIKSGGHISITKYADDTAILCKISKSSCVNDQLNYQQSVNDVVSTCDRKNLLLNAKKSKEMCFANINIKHQGLLSANHKVSPYMNLRDGGDRHPKLPKKGDEQSVLDEILHTLPNVAALESRRMEQQEYLDRARQYGSRVNNLVPSTSRLQSHMLQLHNGTSMPYSVLAAEPIPLHDINLITHTAEKMWNACEGIRVNHKEDLVVNFEIPDN